MTNITGPKGRIIVQKAYGSLGWKVQEDGSARTSYFGSFKDAIKHADRLANTARVYVGNTYAGGVDSGFYFESYGEHYLRIFAGIYGRLEVPKDYLETLIQRLILKHQEIQERNL